MINFFVLFYILNNLELNLDSDFKTFINSLYHKIFKIVVINLITIKFKKIKINIIKNI